MVSSTTFVSAAIYSIAIIVFAAAAATASIRGAPVTRFHSPWQSAGLRFDDGYCVLSAYESSRCHKKDYRFVIGPAVLKALASRTMFRTPLPTLLRPPGGGVTLPFIHILRGGGGASPDDGQGDDAPAPTTGSVVPCGTTLPYKLGIRDSIMIAHSFHGHPSFGPAGGMHGATYTVDVEFSSSELHPECNWVIDIGAASDLLAQVLKRYNYQNLDELFGNGVMTTTEFMCRTIFDGLAELLKRKDGGGVSFEGRIKVTLLESHKAWASYEGQYSDI